MALTECPSCGEMIEVSDKAKLGQRVVCNTCEAVLEVVWLEPMELDWPYEDEMEYLDEEEYEDFEEEPW